MNPGTVNSQGVPVHFDCHQFPLLCIFPQSATNHFHGCSILTPPFLSLSTSKKPIPQKRKKNLQGLFFSSLLSSRIVKIKQRMAAKSPVFTALQRSHFGDHGLDPQINLQVFEKTKRNRKVAMAFGRPASTTTTPSSKSLQVQNPLARGGRERNSLKKIGKVRRWWNRTLVFFWKMRRRFEPRTSLPSSYDIRRIKLGDGPSTIRACPAPIYGSADAFPRRRSLPARRGRAAEDGEFNVPYLRLKEFNMDRRRFSTPTAPIYLVT